MSDNEFQTTRKITIANIDSAYDTLIECSKQAVSIGDASAIRQLVTWAKDKQLTFINKRFEIAKKFGNPVDEKKTADSAQSRVQVPPDKMQDFTKEVKHILETVVKLPEEIMLTKATLKDIRISASALDAIAPFIRDL